MRAERAGASWARRLRCSRTGEAGELERPAFLSPAGAPWGVEYDLDRERATAWAAELATRPWSLWRYRELLPPVDPAERVDLGEGGTPLVRVGRGAPEGVRVWLKEESGNPTGSFKARGLSLAVNRARRLGAPGVQLPSAGNAGIALAAYGAAAGLPVRVAVPAETPRPVVERCLLHGAEVIRAGDTLVEAGERLAERDDGFWSLATLKEPYRAEGKKTMGLEVAEQLGWRLPDWIVYPTGGGTGIVGMHRAFAQLAELGLHAGEERPRFVVAQMRGCAPIVRAFEAGKREAEPWPEPRTRVWGLRVPRAIGDFLVLAALRESAGEAVAVAEERLPEVSERLAREAGLLVGPEGAAAWSAMEELVAAGRIGAGQTVVVFQTGHPANYGSPPAAGGAE